MPKKVVIDMEVRVIAIVDEDVSMDEFAESLYCEDGTGFVLIKNSEVINYDIVDSE